MKGKRGTGNWPHSRWSASLIFTVQSSWTMKWGGTRNILDVCACQWFCINKENWLKVYLRNRKSFSLPPSCSPDKNKTIPVIIFLTYQGAFYFFQVLYSYVKNIVLLYWDLELSHITTCRIPNCRSDTTSTSTGFFNEMMCCCF